MAYYIGIDLGTSACKLLLADEVGAVLNEVTKEYPLSFPGLAGQSKARRTGGEPGDRACPNC